MAANLISMPFTFVYSGVMVLWSTLPTTFARAFVIAVIQFVCLAMIGLIMFVQFGGLELMRR